MLCTENLTPFLSLLPSKGYSGLSSLLAQPSTIFSWGFKTEGIEVIMPTDESPGQWTGWWEGVVDLVPPRGGKRDFSIESLFNKGLPRSFSEADKSVLRLIMPESAGLRVNPQPGTKSEQWLDGRERQVVEWDLLDASLAGSNVVFSWGEEGFQYRALCAESSDSSPDLAFASSQHLSNGHCASCRRRSLFGPHRESQQPHTLGSIQRSLAVVGQRMVTRDHCNGRLQVET